jgi:hypothetical protein
MSGQRSLLVIGVQRGFDDPDRGPREAWLRERGIGAIAVRDSDELLLRDDSSRSSLLQ